MYYIFKNVVQWTFNTNVVHFRFVILFCRNPCVNLKMSYFSLSCFQKAAPSSRKNPELTLRIFNAIHFQIAIHFRLISCVKQKMLYKCLSCLQNAEHSSRKSKPKLGFTIIPKIPMSGVRIPPLNILSSFRFFLM